MKTVTIALVGAGNRGMRYAEYFLENPERGRITAVAEPRDYYREQAKTAFNLKDDQVHKSWESLANKEKTADAVIIATPDAVHTGPAIAFARAGYHILLEKPMAPNAEECIKIIDEVKKADVLFSVCHVLRYTPYTKQLKDIVDSGFLGNLISMQHLEPVGYWHYAHSFVRGNWRNEAESSFMLLAKSCHDLDWIHYFMNEKCVQVSSFGHLNHFRKANKPKDAAARCVSCPVEPDCPYSAKKIYLGHLENGNNSWPVNVITPEPTEESVNEALTTGPYGRCVYDCDNDVVDNQVVILDFENGKTADFSMVAFTPHRPSRQSQLFGSRGHLYGDSNIIKKYRFLDDTTEEIDTHAASGSISGGHGGGDTAIMEHFVEAVAAEDASRILSGPDETLESHLMVFAAETARRERRTVNMEEFIADLQEK
jgi:predicted dehydrogenase